MVFEAIPVEQFSKDHWDMLTYLENRVVSYSGTIQRHHLRVRPNENEPRKLKYPTVLRDRTRVEGHDDFNVINDLISAGYVEKSDDKHYKLTDEGWRVVGLLRRAISEYNINPTYQSVYDTFNPNPEKKTKKEQPPKIVVEERSAFPTQSE